MSAVLLYDNARPHTSVYHSFEWTVMPHPPYSSDLITSAYHLFVTFKKGL